MRKKVPSLPCTPPSFKNRSYFHKKALLACRPGGLSCGRRMLPRLSVMSHPGFFLSASPPARPACAQKTNTCARQACDIRAVHRRTTRGTGTQLRGKCFRDWTGDWEKEGQLLQKRPFPQSALRQNSHPILTADRHPAFMHMTTNGAITVSDVGAVRPKPPESASQGFLLFSCGCLIRACIMARAGLALLHSEYPR